MISVGAAETLIQVEVAEACSWLANLLSKMRYGNPDDKHKIKIECHTGNQQL